MSKSRRWVILLLVLAVLVMIGLNITDRDELATPVDNSQVPTYQTEHSNTLAYSPEGKLSYQLVADHAEYFASDGVSWFTKPVMTSYDKNIAPAWAISADRAKLTSEQMLYLYGNVELKALSPDAQLRRITTDNAIVNLVTQDVSSEDRVTVYGSTFNSSGLKMRGNLRDKTARLIDKVKSSYEIQNNQK